LGTLSQARIFGQTGRDSFTLGPGIFFFFPTFPPPPGPIPDRHVAAKYKSSETVKHSVIKAEENCFFGRSNVRLISKLFVFSVS